MRPQGGTGRPSRRARPGRSWTAYESILIGDSGASGACSGSTGVLKRCRASLARHERIRNRPGIGAGPAGRSRRARRHETRHHRAARTPVTGARCRSLVALNLASRQRRALGTPRTTPHRLQHERRHSRPEDAQGPRTARKLKDMLVVLGLAGHSAGHLRDRPPSTSLAGRLGHCGRSSRDQPGRGHTRSRNLNKP